MDELKKHFASLEVADIAEVWVDSAIKGGADWNAEIDDRLIVADVILLLLSSDYLASTYCRAEMEIAVRRGHEGSARVVPVILRYCDWQNLPVATFQALPHDGKPIVGSPNLDEARTMVTLALRQIVDELRSARA